jgi:SAM-dependent methyltransferase
MVPGTQGYAEQATELIARYEELRFPYKHEAIMHLLPVSPVEAIDISAGTGADADRLASRGHRVVAVEPTAPFRAFGVVKHSSPLITWVNDALPHLSVVAATSKQFELIMLTAVWMHLAEQDRAVAMPVLARLLSPPGVMVMALRHGPAPEARMMFAVSPQETIGLAREAGLRCVLNVQVESRQEENRRAGVTWSRLAFRWA